MSPNGLPARPFAAGEPHAAPAQHVRPLTPRSHGLAALRSLCATADVPRNGRVKRLQLERWLNHECRALVCQMPATTVFDLLQTHAYGARLPMPLQPSHTHL
jgi:hypothetical protein